MAWLREQPLPPALARQTALTCSGHTRPVVDLDFNVRTSDASFLLSAAKGAAVGVGAGVGGEAWA
jgi:hypothetical protein